MAYLKRLTSHGLKLAGLLAGENASEVLFAGARLLLAIAAIVAILLDGIEPPRLAGAAHILLAVYFGYSAVVLLILRFAPRATAALGRITHITDIGWAGAICLVTAGSNSTFFLFVLFVLIAAYRWGIRRVIATAAVLVGILLLEAALLMWGPIRRLVGEDYELNRLIMRAAYLVVASVLVGVLAESEKRLRKRESLTTTLLEIPRAELGFTGSVQAVVQAIMRRCGVECAAVVFQDAFRARTFVGHVHLRPASTLQWTEISAACIDQWLFRLPVQSACIIRDAEAAEWISGRDHGTIALPKTCAGRDFRVLLLTDFAVGKDWTGRILLFEPKISTDIGSLPSLFGEMVRHV